MRISISKRRLGIVLALALVIALAACGRGTPVEPHAADDLKEGPGLLTGEEGRFVIYRAQRGGED